MFREIINSERPAAARRAGWFGDVVIGPTENGAYVVDVRATSGADGEVGNPCIGIMIGCLLSLPLWAGIVAAAYWLH